MHLPLPQLLVYVACYPGMFVPLGSQLLVPMHSTQTNKQGGLSAIVFLICLNLSYHSVPLSARSHAIGKTHVFLYRSNLAGLLTYFIPSSTFPFLEQWYVGFEEVFHETHSSGSVQDFHLIPYSFHTPKEWKHQTLKYEYKGISFRSISQAIEIILINFAEHVRILRRFIISD